MQESRTFRNRTIKTATGWLFAWCALAVPGNAQQRSQPPEFTPSQQAIFYDDVSAALVGTRPGFTKQALPTKVATEAPERDLAAAWSDWISPDTIESEIKRQSQRIATLTQSATIFKGGGYRDARNAFSTLAIMFRLAAEHPDRARWREVGRGMASVLGRAAANCKVGTDGSYREAAARAQDLADLVRGSRPTVPKSPPDQLWSDLADRTPIMVRMEDAIQSGLSAALASPRDFSRQAPTAAHQAQVLAVLAELLTQQEYPDCDDEDYTAYAVQLRAAAAAVSQAAQEENYQAARAAAGNITKACSNCHDDYRG